MSRYIGPKEKISRKLGENIALKAERSFGPKSAFLRKPYRPGQHGKRMRRGLSEFGTQLLEKQKVRFTYGVGEGQFKNYFAKAKAARGVTGNLLLSMLEKRLDNTVYRAGFAASRVIARQLVNHGHFWVNGKKVSIPSYEVKIGDAIEVRPQSKSKVIFSGLSEKLKKYEAPEWLIVDKKTLQAKIKSEPQIEEIAKHFNISSIIEYYSR